MSKKPEKHNDKGESMPERYAVIDDETGDIINIVMWDGVSDWSPGKGFTVRKATDDDRIATPIDPES